MTDREMQLMRVIEGDRSEIEAQLDALSKVARDWSNCPTDQAQIGRARRDRGLLEKHTG